MNKAYIELKLAWQLHGQAPEKLPQPERLKLQGIVKRQEALESLILRSPEAMCSVVTPEAIQEQMAAIRGRYEHSAAFEADLLRLGMDVGALEEAIVRDLVIEYTLERVTSALPPVSDTEAEIFYHLHPERFTQPERRELRHILLTFTDAAEGQAAQATLQALRASLTSQAAFAAEALRHSHCPSALEGGRLGWAIRGQLFPEVEAAAFALAAGELSPVVGSEMGWHLLRCDAIEPERRLTFAAVKAELVQRLTAARVERARRQWIVGLQGRMRSIAT